MARLEDVGRPALAHGPARRKLFVLLGLVASSYALLFSGLLDAWWLALVVAISQPVYLITAMGIAHDGSHAAVSERPFINRLATGVFDLLGVNGYIWNFDHVTAHHTTPNVSRYDANLYGWGPIRLDPHVERRWFHRFQHLYAPFIYALASLFKIYLGDFIAFTRTRVEAYLPLAHARREVVRLVGFKLWAVSVALVLPIVINGQAGFVFAGYLLGHMFAGLLMGAIFQPTHTNELVDWPLPDDDARMRNTFDAHVLATSADFSISNPFVTWIAGGLNIHAIHHLFPRIPHMRLIETAAIVSDLAPRHGLRYQRFETWWAAICSHFRALHALGRTPTASITPAAVATIRS